MFENEFASIARFLGLSGTTSACDRALVVLRMYEQNQLGFLGHFAIHAFFWFVLQLITLPLLLSIIGLRIPILITFVVALMISAWSNSRVRVVICENGLEFYGMRANAFFRDIGKPVYCAWEDLSHFDVVFTHTRNGTGHSLILHLKNPPGVTIDIAKVISIPTIQRSAGDWRSYRDYLVVDPDALALSPFGRIYLTKYAPQVIESARKRHQEAEAYIRSG